MIIQSTRVQPELNYPAGNWNGTGMAYKNSCQYDYPEPDSGSFREGISGIWFSTPELYPSIPKGWKSLLAYKSNMDFFLIENIAAKLKVSAKEICLSELQALS